MAVRRFLNSIFLFIFPGSGLIQLTGDFSAKIKAYIQTVRRALIARHYDQVVVLTTADASRWKWFCKNVVVMPNPLTIATDKPRFVKTNKLLP